MTEGPKGISSEVVFFLGAGASVRAGVPDTYSFVKEFKESLDKSEREIVGIIQEKLILWKKQRGEEERVDIELLMEVLDKLTRKDEEALLHFYEVKRFLLEGFPEMNPLLDKIKDFVKRRTIVPDDKVGYLEPLLGFIEEYQPLDIFSVNYDLSIEQFCNVYKKSYQDGFDVEWNPKVFSSLDTDIRLYKLHGSITWYKTSRGTFVKSLIKSKDERIELLTGEKAESLMLYPMRKWEYAEPFLENLLTFKNRLQSESCKYVVVVGYSFRDEYIRDIFWDAARKNKELMLILVDPAAFQIYSEKLEYYSRTEGVPSSLRGRVLSLPFYFELVLPVLRTQYLSNLKVGVNCMKQANTEELAGDASPGWIGCLQPMADCQYVDKMDELIENKVGFSRVFKNTMNLTEKVKDMKLLRLRVGQDIRLLQDILFKRCMAFYINRRRNEGEQAFLDLIATARSIFVANLSIGISAHEITLRPDTQPNGGFYPLDRLVTLYSDFINYRNPVRYDRLYDLIKRPVDFVTQMSLYLFEWDKGSLSYPKYIDLRRADFPQETGEISKLHPQVASLLAAGQAEKHVVVARLEELILKIERNIVSSIIEEFVSPVNS